MFTTFCSVEKEIKTLQIYLAQRLKKKEWRSSLSTTP